MEPSLPGLLALLLLSACAASAMYRLDNVNGKRQPRAAIFMLTDRPCDLPVVPDECAHTSGLISVQQPINGTDFHPGAESDVFLFKNAVVFISKKHEGVDQDLFKIISGLVTVCIRELVRNGLDVDLTQVADCTSIKMMETPGVGLPRGIFFSRQNSASWKVVLQLFWVRGKVPLALIRQLKSLVAAMS